MEKKSNIKITFLSREQNIINNLKTYLKRYGGFDFEFITDELRDISQLQYDCLVSPANSYGELKGGVDMCYYMNLGKEDLQNAIYHVIKNKFYGEILIGQCCCFPLEVFNPGLGPKYLLLCPTMTIPADVSQTRNAYYFARALLTKLFELKKLNIEIKTVLCPIPCVGVGQMDSKMAAMQIDLAFDSIINKKGAIFQIYATDVNELNNQPSMQANSVLYNAKIAYIQYTVPK